MKAGPFDIDEKYESVLKKSDLQRAQPSRPKTKAKEKQQEKEKAERA